MVTIYSSVEDMPELQPGTVWAYNSPLEDSIDVTLASDTKDDETDVGVFGDGTVFTYRDADTDELTGFSIRSASTVIEAAISNRFHIIRDFIPEQTILDLWEVRHTHRVGYAAIHFPTN